MPTQDNQVETTLADLAVNLVFERTPSLADHYLGFELVPGSQNEEKTRAAGLLGFRVGNEELYIPVLFLNGKVKGTEIIYLKNADVFTSNSKQWIDYLTTRDTGTMGQGATPKHPLQQPPSRDLAVFSRAPGTLGKLGSFFDGAAEDFWNKVATSGGEWIDAPSSEALTIKNVLRSLGKEAYLKFATFLDDNPALLAKVAQVFDLEKEILIYDWPEEKTASVEDQEAELLGKIASFITENKGPFFLLPENIELLSKEASLSLSPEQKEQCFTEGFIVMDKRAEDETTLVVKEDYRTRFESPRESGFYEILNSGGSLEKVFIAHQPFVVDEPRNHLSGCLVLDPESGVYVLPVAGEQVFVRSRFSPEESIWKEKFGKMPSVSSMEIGKSYMLVSPSMQASSPFRVSGKTKGDNGLSFKCSTPWDIKYRSSPRISTSYGLCAPVSMGHDGERSLQVVDRDDESKVVTIGNITFTPSSWKVIEVYEDSNSLQYDYGNYPTDSDAQKKIQAEKDKMRKVYFKILPGNSRTISAVIANKDILELTIHKSASDYTVRLDKEIIRQGNKVAALETLISDLGLSEKSARALLDEPLDQVGSKQWLVMKEANERPDVKAEEILPMKGVLPFVLDTIGGPYMSNRAGRAVAMGRSVGRGDEEIDKRLRYPMGMQFADVLGGTALGAVGGGLLGAGLGAGLSVISPQKTPPSGESGKQYTYPTSVIAGRGGMVGAGAGAALGYLLGIVHNIKKKREAMRQISGEFNYVDPKDRVDGKDPTNLRASDFLPYVGPHHKGERDTYRYLKGESDQKPEFGASTHAIIPAGFIGNAIAPGLGNAAMIGADIYQGVSSSKENQGHKESDDAVKERLRSRGIQPKHAAESADDAFERILFGKQAAGPSLNGDNLIYGGMGFPEDNAQIGTNQSGMTEVAPQVLNHPIPLNNMGDPTQDWRDLDQANWDKIQNKDMDFLMRAADSGSKPVFESSIINLLLRSNRTSNQVAEWLPDYVNSLDSKCRLLLSFYWHNSDFAESYGKDEMAEFEDVLLDSIKIDGQLILFLKQRAGESAYSNIDAFAG